jgi:hypothetical protein
MITTEPKGRGRDLRNIVALCQWDLAPVVSDRLGTPRPAVPQWSREKLDQGDEPGESGCATHYPRKEPRSCCTGVDNDRSRAARAEKIARAGAMNGLPKVRSTQANSGLESPKLAEVRPMIVGWSTVDRCPIRCVMHQSSPAHGTRLHAL